MEMKENSRRIQPIALLLAAFVCLLASSPSARAAIVSVTCADATSDTAALNNAIAGSSTGDLIQIHGTCLINATITTPGDRSYIGDSRTGTVIQQAPGSNLPAMLAGDTWVNNNTWTGAPVRIAHLTLDGNSGAGNTGTVGLMLRAWGSVIEDVQVENTASDGIRVTSPSQNGTTLPGTQVNSRISNVYVHDVGGIGIYVSDPSATSVTDSDILDSWFGNIAMTGIYLDNAAGWKIHGNHLYSIGGSGIDAESCWNTAIEDNYIEDFGDANSGSYYYGIRCVLQPNVTGAVINGNKLNQLKNVTVGYDFIDLSVKSAGMATATVVGNNIYGANAPNDTGLSYNNGSGSAHVLSSNNVQNVHYSPWVDTNITVVNTGQ